MHNTHLRIGHGAHRVIALHGWFGHAGGWGPFTQQLNTQDFSYVFMDQRGYGGMRRSGGPYTVEQIAQDALAPGRPPGLAALFAHRPLDGRLIDPAGAGRRARARACAGRSHARLGHRRPV